MSRYDTRDFIDQILRQHEAGLKAYLVCRMGGAAKLAPTYDELCKRLGGGLQHFQQGPSLLAVAYATARQLVPNGDSTDDARAQSLTWKPTPKHQMNRYVDALDLIRVHLDPIAAEVLELHYARGLNPREVGYVLDLTAEDTQRHLTEGSNNVSQMVSGLLGADFNLKETISDAYNPRLTVPKTSTTQSHVQAPRLSVGTTIDGRFELSSSPTNSGMYAQYIATDTNVLGQSVSLQLFHRPAQTSAARIGMMRKLQLLDSMVHPALDKSVAYGWHEDRLWYATTQRQGHTLQTLVEERALSPNEALDIFTPIARVLSICHARGVVHRNVSPTNIHLVQTGVEGLSETLPQLSGMETWLTGSFADQQTPICAAPEVAKRLHAKDLGGGAATPNEDVFSLGATLFFALSPKDQPKHQDDWSEFLNTRAKASPEVPKSSQLELFAPLLCQALSLDPQARPTASEFAAYLERLSPRIESDRRNRQIMFPVVVLVAALSLLGIAYFVRESQRVLIRQGYDATDSQVLRQELEAEKTRSKKLEERLRSSNPSGRE